MFLQVFNCNLGTPIEGYEVRLLVKENVVPVFTKAYYIPFFLRCKVEKKLNEMLSKKTGDVRICTDLRTTVNNAINIDQYSF